MPYESAYTGPEIDGAVGDSISHVATVSGNPHAVTKSDVGLANVDNTADADKPVSNATSTAISLSALAVAAAVEKELVSLENLVYQVLDEALEEVLIISLSDETTDLTTGDGKATFRMPFAMTLTEVRAHVNTAPVGSTIIVDIEVDADESSGGSILSTLLTIDASEKTSTTAATPAVISNPNLPDDSEVQFNIDQVGSGTAGTGLKVVLKGKRVT